MSAILPVEIRGALRRRAEEKAIEGSRLPAALNRLAADREQWNLLALSTEILRVPFISADRRQVAAAAAVGLPVQQVG